MAVKHAKLVIESLRRWQSSQNESVGGDTIRYHSAKTQNFSRGIRTQETIGILNERKAVGAAYIVCRALTIMVQILPKDAMGEELGHSLEEKTFAQYKRQDPRLLSQSANHRLSADMYAALLGEMANHR